MNQATAIETIYQVAATLPNREQVNALNAAAAALGTPETPADLGGALIGALHEAEQAIRNAGPQVTAELLWARANTVALANLVEQQDLLLEAAHGIVRSAPATAPVPEVPLA